MLECCVHWPCRSRKHPEPQKQDTCVSGRDCFRTVPGARIIFQACHCRRMIMDLHVRVLGMSLLFAYFPSRNGGQSREFRQKAVSEMAGAFKAVNCAARNRLYSRWKCPRIAQRSKCASALLKLGSDPPTHACKRSNFVRYRTKMNVAKGGNGGPMDEQ